MRYQAQMNNNKRIQSNKYQTKCEQLNQSHQSQGFKSKEYYQTKNNEGLLYVEIFMNLNYFIRLKT